jgi:hypothetical protein
VSIDIYLPNGNKQNIDVMSTDQAEDVLEVRYIIWKFGPAFLCSRIP